MFKTWERAVALFFVGVFIVCALACGNVKQAAQKQKQANALKQVALMYHNYNDSFNKGPTGPQDLQQFAGGYPEGMAAIQSGEIVVLYGAKLIEMLDGTSNTVLAYEAAVPTSGGQVVMADGFVKTMTAQEFAAAPKAKAKNQ